MKLALIFVLLSFGGMHHNTNTAEKQQLSYIAFRNYTTMQFNYDDGCEANIVQTGVTKYLTSGTDTICSFKVDAMGVISWKARQGHVVTLGGCNMRSLSISQ